LGMVMAAVVSAEAMARRAHSQDLINRLNEIVMNKWNSYQERRVPIYIGPSVNSAGTVTTPPTEVQYATAQLNALHELMRLEMPDRLSDITDDPITTYTDPAGTKQT